MTYIDRAICFEKQKKNEEALQDYNNALNIEPDSAHIYKERGDFFERTDQYDKAILDYDTAISINPSFSSAYNNKGFTDNINH